MTVGPIIQADSSTVRRMMISTTANERESLIGKWSWHSDVVEILQLPNPETVDLQTNEGAIGGLTYETEPGTDRWAIHIPGHSSGPGQTLRGVPTFLMAGYSNLVLDLRSADGQPRAQTLGLHEAAIAESAINHALSRGARGIVLVGWSMSALTVDAVMGNEAVIGAVLVSPVVSTRSAIYGAAKRAHLPEAFGQLALGLLDSPHFCGVAGERAPIGAENRRLTAGGDKPVLIIHSAGDDVASLADSETYASTSERITLASLPAAPHTLEWNRAPKDWAAAVSKFLMGLIV